jgi:glycosyltransferase involved in cell wall biosynthesis
MKEGILIISVGFRPQVGGLETHLDDLCEYLRGHKHKVFVVTYQPITTKAQGLGIEEDRNLEIHRIPWFGHNWYHRLERYPLILFIYLFPRLFIASFFMLLKRHREVAVIHAHGIIPTMVTKIVARVFRKRCVMSTHTIYSLKERPLLARAMKWILSSFTVILPLAQLSKDELVALGLPEEKFRIYTHWVDLERFRPLGQDRCKAELGLEGRFVVLFVGRFIEKKGMGVLLETSKMVPAVTFAFIGDGPLSGKILQAGRAQDNVLYFGRVPYDELAKYYCAADIFVVPSQYEEGFGRVVAEALACGTPVLASNMGSLSQLVTPSVGVTVAPTGENIAEVVNDLYQNRKKLTTLRANCRAYAEEHFSERNAEVIVEAYKVEMKNENK